MQELHSLHCRNSLFIERITTNKLNTQSSFTSEIWAGIEYRTASWKGPPQIPRFHCSTQSGPAYVTAHWALSKCLKHGPAWGTGLLSRKPGEGVTLWVRKRSLSPSPSAPGCSLEPFPGVPALDPSEGGTISSDEHLVVLCVTAPGCGSVPS